MRMRTKTKSRICTSVVILAFGAALMGGSAFAATESVTAQSGNSDSMVTGVASLGDKGVVKKDKYFYTYAATLRGDSSDAAQEAKVTISGAKSDNLYLGVWNGVNYGQTYQVRSGTSSTNYITVKAQQREFSSQTKTVRK